VLSTEATLRKARNSYYCDWCGELIPAKSHYMRWQKIDDSWSINDGNTTGGWTTYKMHPECLEKFASRENESFRPQTHDRPVKDDAE
jgi:uncharacterized protein RhaS with RHS repeats